jgi:hypothetical protein
MNEDVSYQREAVIISERLSGGDTGESGSSSSLTVTGTSGKTARRARGQHVARNSAQTVDAQVQRSHYQQLSSVTTRERRPST